jgi:hypothetical protein
MADNRELERFLALHFARKRKRIKRRHRRRRTGLVMAALALVSVAVVGGVGFGAERRSRRPCSLATA